MTRCHIVVPARYASTRLPGKPLADIAGQPMIIRVLQQVSRAAVDSVVAAVDHPDVLACVEAAGFEAVNTRDDHQSGTDRIMEVAAQRGWSDEDIVVNVQGDEPLMPVSVIAALAPALAEVTSAVRTGGNWTTSAPPKERLSTGFPPLTTRTVSPAADAAAAIRAVRARWPMPSRCWT